MVESRCKTECNWDNCKYYETDHVASGLGCHRRKPDVAAEAQAAVNTHLNAESGFDQALLAMAKAHPDSAQAGRAVAIIQRLNEMGLLPVIENYAESKLHEAHLEIKHGGKRIAELESQLKIATDPGVRQAVINAGWRVPEGWEDMREGIAAVKTYTPRATVACQGDEDGDV